MRWKTQSLVAGVLCLAWSAPAYACSMWLNSTFIGMVARPVISIGMQSVENFMIISADVALKAGDKVSIRPAVGTCRYTGPGGGSEMVFGGAVGANIWNDATGKIAINAQAGAEIVSYDDGTARNIPIGLAVRYNLSSGSSGSRAPSGLAQGGGSGDLDLYGGGALHLYNDSSDGESYSSTDPSLFGGVQYMTGSFTLTGGITMYLYDGGNELAINVGGGFALGSASNAIRTIASLFSRK